MTTATEPSPTTTASRTGRLLSIRPLAVDELDVFHHVVYDAAAFRPGPHPPQEELLATDHFRPYVEGWGRHGDRCLLACLDDEPVGGVFYRLFRPPAVGDGFLDEQTPELGIAMFEGHRASGLGRAVIHAGLAQARLDGFSAISLGVADDNRAGRLYESVGFVTAKVIKGGRVMVFSLGRTP